MSAPVGLLLPDDLIFPSRITATAQAHGLAVTPARTAALLLALAEQAPPACVVVDLDNPGLDIEGLVRQLQAAPAPPFVVAYGPAADPAGVAQAPGAGRGLGV